MNRAIEILAVQDRPRQKGKRRRNRNRYSKPRFRFIPQDAEEKPEPRFQIDSIASTRSGDSPKSAMRVLLQNSKTLKFFGTDEHWTHNSKQARDFGSGWWATINAFTMDTSHLVIHYEFGDARYDLQIPVSHSEPEELLLLSLR
jgi:hypothetical protein